MAKITNFPPKDPTETKDYPLDFADDLGPNETIVSATSELTYFRGTGDINDLSTYLEGSPVITGTVVTQKVKLGLTLSFYHLLITATTSGGQVLVRAGIIPVKNV